MQPVGEAGNSLAIGKSDDSPRRKAGASRKAERNIPAGGSFATAPSEPSVRFNLAERVRGKGTLQETRVTGWHTNARNVRAFTQANDLAWNLQTRLSCLCAKNTRIVAHMYKPCKRFPYTARITPLIPRAFAKGFHGVWAKTELSLRH